MRQEETTVQLGPGKGNDDQDNNLTSHGIVPQYWWLSSQPPGRKIFHKRIEVPAEGH